MPDCKPRRKAFTLVELLVVVAIIAMLLAILLPALNKAKFQARVVLCKSVLRGIGTTMHVYATEYAGYFPMGPDRFNGTSWLNSPWQRSWSLTGSGFDLRPVYQEYLGGPLNKYMKCPLAVEWYAERDLDTYLHNGSALVPYMLFTTNNWRTKSFGFSEIGAYEKNDTEWSPVSFPDSKFTLLASDFIFGNYSFKADAALSTHPGPNGSYGRLGNATNNQVGHDLGKDIEAPINYCDGDGSVHGYTVDGLSYLDRTNWLYNDQSKGSPKGAYKFLLPRELAR